MEMKARAQQVERAGLPFPEKFYVSPISTPASCKWIVSEYLHELLYAVSRREQRSGHKPDVILHDGLSLRDATLASFRLIDAAPQTWKMRLPPRDAEPEAGFELVSAGSDWRAQKRPVFKFAVATAVGAEGRGVGAGAREHFEWRTSNNDNIRRILDSQALGWKLVRLTHDAFTDRIPSPRGAWPKTSDNAEVVAVFPSNGAFEGNWRFAFLGTGRNGLLGYRWEVMAFTTAMIILD
jgi:hypothetical protein